MKELHNERTLPGVSRPSGISVILCIGHVTDVEANASKTCRY